jgi:hypothetical protein
MRIVMLDLMPLLWAMCAVAALLLLYFRSFGAPARTLPAVTVALFLYGMGYPPRVQTAAFLFTFAVAAIIWAALRFIGARRQKSTTTTE